MASRRSSSSSHKSSASASTSSSKRLRTGKSSSRKKSRDRSEDRSSHHTSSGSRRTSKQRRVLPARDDSGSDVSSETPERSSDSEEEPQTSKLSLHERFGSLPPPPDMFEERQRDVEMEKVRKRSTTSFAITMNEFPNPEKQHRQTSSERFGRIQLAAAGGARASFEQPHPSIRSGFEEQEVSFQPQSLQQFRHIKPDDLPDPFQFTSSHPFEQPRHNDNFANPIQLQSFPLPRPQLRLDPEQTIYQNPSMLQGFVNAMQGVRGANGQNRDNRAMGEMQDNAREPQGYGRGPEDYDDYGMRHENSSSAEFDLLAMGEPTNQPWQLRQGGIAGVDKDGFGPAGRMFGGRGVRDIRGLKGKVIDQRDGRGEPSVLNPPNLGPRPPIPQPPPRSLRPQMLPHIPGPRPPFGGGPPLMSLRPGSMNGLGNPMRPELRLGGPDMNEGAQQRIMPPGSLQGPRIPPIGGMGPLRPMGGPPPNRMLHLGNMQPNPRLMGLPMGQPPNHPMGGPQQLPRIFPMGGAQFRPPTGPHPGLRLQGLPPRPVMPQPKALVPPGGWAHLPSKVVGAHAPRGVGGPRRTKPGRLPPPLEPKSDLDADLDQYRSEAPKGIPDTGGEQGDARNEEAVEDDEIEAPAEEDLGDIGVLE